MSLSELQRMLAQVVTDPDLREHFLGDTEGMAESKGWDARLAGVLATVDHHRLRHYGASLVNKRCREAARCLPLTFQALGSQRFRSLFREHAVVSTTRGPARHRDDAISFAQRLRRERSDVSGHPSWLSDLAAYEAASLRAGDPKRRMVFLLLGHSPRELAKAARSGNLAAGVPRRFSLVFWFRLTRNSPSRQFHLIIPPY